MENNTIVNFDTSFIMRCNMEDNTIRNIDLRFKDADFLMECLLELRDSFADSLEATLFVDSLTDLIAILYPQIYIGYLDE